MSKYETTYNKARQLLEGGGAVRCNELTAALKSLGFNVKDASSGGHKTYDHPGIPDFHGSSYNCGHGKNPEVKRNYPRAILKVLDEYKTELLEWGRTKSNG